MRRQPRTGLKRAIALMCCALTGIYAASPVAAAVEVATAIQRGDADAFAARIDWASLRPHLSAALLQRTQLAHTGPLPGFIARMADDTAARLSSPEGLVVLLRERLAARGDVPGREMLSSIRVLEANLWEFTLTALDRPERTVRLTLAPMDTLWLRWEVRSIEIPTRATISGSAPMS